MRRFKPSKVRWELFYYTPLLSALCMFQTLKGTLGTPRPFLRARPGGTRFQTLKGTLGTGRSRWLKNRLLVWFQTLKGTLGTRNHWRVVPMRNVFQTLKGTLGTVATSARVAKRTTSFKPSKVRWEPSRIPDVVRVSSSFKPSKVRWELASSMPTHQPLPCFKPSKVRWELNSTNWAGSSSPQFQTLKGTLGTHSFPKSREIRCWLLFQAPPRGTSARAKIAP